MIEALPVPAGEAALGLLPRLRRALLGEAPVMPYAASAPIPPVPEHDLADLPEGLAVAIGTSGSTGTPKRAQLTPDALGASGTATHDRLGGPGQWLLALPAQHIAGLQVLLRSVLADTTPVVLDPAGGFDARTFSAAVRRMDPGARRYVSLVPTQLVRLCDDPWCAETLQLLDAVLVGGAAMPPLLRRHAEACGIRVVPTYGMSETAGGCVYDGNPLDGSLVDVDGEGRVHLGGSTLAAGYLGRPRLSATVFHDGWFRTDDVGHLDPDGRLHVDGRVDDVINTGGVKVAPRLVEDAIAEHVSGIREVVVVGTPDPTWGEAVSAFLVLERHIEREPTLRDLRATLRGILADHALPRRVLVAAEVPTRGPGKPDRAGIVAMFGRRAAQMGQ
jgi:O-succinylbenzoic acid--CoA ligase